MKFFEVLELYSCLSCQLKTLRKFLNSNEFFSKFCYWEVLDFYPNCDIMNGCLYDCKGKFLASDDSCMDEKIPYFVNQVIVQLDGYSHGIIYLKINEQNSFVAMSYSRRED